MHKNVNKMAEECTPEVASRSIIELMSSLVLYVKRAIVMRRVIFHPVAPRVYTGRHDATHSIIELMSSLVLYVERAIVMRRVIFHPVAPRVYTGRHDATDRQDTTCRRRTVNWVTATDILVDTGATQTLVCKDLVSEDDILDDEVTIHCAHRHTSSYPLAVVAIVTSGKDIITTTGTLPTSVLLGCDVPKLIDCDRQPVQPRTKPMHSLF